MATKNIVPRGNNEGSLGTSVKKWNAVNAETGSFTSLTGSFSGDGSGLTGITSTASPAGSDTNVQFNDGGSTGADSNFTFDKTTDSLFVAGAVSGSLTSTGSFGRLETAGDINSDGRIFEQNTSVIDHATAMAIVFGG
jgi:hypothetical protein